MRNLGYLYFGYPYFDMLSFLKYRLWRRCGRGTFSWPWLRVGTGRCCRARVEAINLSSDISHSFCGRRTELYAAYRGLDSIWRITL